MIDNQQLRAEDAFASLEIKAFGVIGTAAAEAIAAVALDEIPQSRLRLKVQIAAAAVARGPRPSANLLQLLHRRRLDEQRAGALLRSAQPPQAEVIRAALDQRGVERLRHNALQKRNVFVDELFLQADGMRRDDDAAFLIGSRRQDSGHEVGKRFTYPCTGFDHEMTAFGDGLSNGIGHVQLLHARLVAGQLASDDAVGTEDGSDGHEKDYCRLGDEFIVISQGRWMAAANQKNSANREKDGRNAVAAGY